MVDPEEAAALAATMSAEKAGDSSRVSVVVPRDFTEPRTLSADRIDRIQKTLSARLQSMANLYPILVYVVLNNLLEENHEMRSNHFRLKILNYLMHLF